MNEPIQHHFVPSVYLDAFSGPAGMVESYDKVADRFYAGRPKNLARRRDYNTVSLSDGTADRITMEKFYGDFETKFPRILIDARARSLSFEQQRDLIVFATLQMMRSPMTRDTLTFLAQNFFPNDSTLAAFGAKKHAIDILARARAGERAALLDELGLLLSGDFFNAMSKIVEQLDYCIVSLRNSPDLLTCDNPAVVQSISKDQQGRWKLDINAPGKRTVLIYPLSPTDILLGDNKGKISNEVFKFSYFEIHGAKNFVECANVLAHSNARRNTYARSIETLKSAGAALSGQRKSGLLLHRELGQRTKKLLDMLYSQRRSATGK